jgi:predicted GNAT family N-acyltransferase
MDDVGENATDLRVLTVTRSDDRERAFAIRRQVFQVEQGVPAEEEFDADDGRAIHLLAVIPGRAVGTARIVFHPDYAKIGRMAVLKEWRRHGVGRALMQALMRTAAARTQSHLVLHAQVHAIPFYEAMGFRVVGDEFEEAGIPHRKMERTTVQSPR